ncbi:uncharacterized protein LOC134682039 [Mytilus trossulus]|uniref:uncharacterized protein LOC134682039 n=1 Tax=Mytilus trossulus TaxID=6551 RepID=UPI003003F6FC
MIIHVCLHLKLIHVTCYQSIETFIFVGNILGEVKNTETSSEFVGSKNFKDTDQVRTRRERDKLVMASKMEKPGQTTKGKPHTKKQKTATESENILKELAAENQAYQLADPKNEESGIAPPINPKDTRMFHRECAPRIYNVEKHTYEIDHLLYIYISKQNDIILVGIKNFFAIAPSRILKPGKTGIYLTVDQYCKLISKGDSISKAIQQIKEDKEGKGLIKMDETKLTEKDKSVAAKSCFVISKEKKVKVEYGSLSGRQQVVVDIREYSRPTEQSGEIPLPTDKGINLTEEQWTTLLSLHSTVIKDLEDNFGYSEDFADELSA